VNKRRSTRINNIVTNKSDREKSRQLPITTLEKNEIGSNKS
jgi:hypothetical protein